MTIGAPKSAVIIFIGNVPNGKISVMIENININKTPVKIIQRNNNFISPVFRIERQICGIAKPIKPIGPVKAVAEAVNIAVANKINIFKCLILIPKLIA